MRCRALVLMARTTEATQKGFQTDNSLKLNLLPMQRENRAARGLLRRAWREKRWKTKMIHFPICDATSMGEDQASSSGDEHSEGAQH